jgi:hypothetical protein
VDPRSGIERQAFDVSKAAPRLLVAKTRLIRAVAYICYIELYDALDSTHVDEATNVQFIQTVLVRETLNAQGQRDLIVRSTVD